MNHRIPKLALVSLAMFAQCSSIHATEPPQLLHNPFSRPPSEVAVSDRSQLRSDGSVQTLDLQATLVAAAHRLANVAGNILRPGDEIQGYTLLQVFEDHAVFEREGSRLTVFVKPYLEKDDE